MPLTWPISIICTMIPLATRYGQSHCTTYCRNDIVKECSVTTVLSRTGMLTDLQCTCRGSHRSGT